MTLLRQRTYTYRREVSAGCFVCHGGDGHWFGKNAQAVAARHYDATGHETWVDVQMSIHYKNTDKSPAPPPHP